MTGSVTLSRLGSLITEYSSTDDVDVRDTIELSNSCLERQTQTTFTDELYVQLLRRRTTAQQHHPPTRLPAGLHAVDIISEELHYMDTGYGQHQRTPTDKLTTILQLVVQQIHHQRTKICHIPTSWHVEMLGSGIAIWQICCPRIVVVVSVAGVRSRCPCQGSKISRYFRKYRKYRILSRLLIFSIHISDIFEIFILQHWIRWCQLKGLCLSCIFQNGATKNNNNNNTALCSTCTVW